MRQLLSSLLVAVLSSTALAAPLFELETVAGMGQQAVEGVLGKPTSIQSTKHGPKLVFAGGMLEIVFINGKADWITLTPKASVTYGPQALAMLGLPAIRPTSGDAKVIRWEPCGQLASVSIFSAGDKVGYFYIKVSTK